MDNTLAQSAVLLYTCYGGALMGVLYDVLRLLRYGPRWFAYLSDVLFWAGSFIIILLVLNKASALEFRIYEMLGFALGFAAYWFTLGYLVRALCLRLWRLSQRFIGFLAHMLE